MVPGDTKLPRNMYKWVVYRELPADAPYNDTRDLYYNLVNDERLKFLHVKTVWIKGKRLGYVYFKTVEDLERCITQSLSRADRKILAI